MTNNDESQDGARTKFIVTEAFQNHGYVNINVQQLCTLTLKIVHFKLNKLKNSLMGVTVVAHLSIFEKDLTTIFL